MPFAIVHWFGWTVAKHILVAQLDADFRGYVRQLIRVINGKGPATSHIRDFGQQGGTQALLLGAGRLVEQADSVDLDVRLFDQGVDFALGVAAVVIAAIGDDEQGFAVIAGGA